MAPLKNALVFLFHLVGGPVGAGGLTILTFSAGEVMLALPAFFIFVIVLNEEYNIFKERRRQQV